MNKILVIESETGLLNLLAELLDLYGFCPITTISSKEGYELIKIEQPQLILYGHSSTHLTSYETCWQFLEQIRQDSEITNIPFILMTGANLETISNWQNYISYQDILFKPFSSQVLLEKIHSHLQSGKIQDPNIQHHKSSGKIPSTDENVFFTKKNQTTYYYRYLFA